MPAAKRRTNKSQEACPCEGNSLDRLIQPAILACLATEPLHGYALVQRLGEVPTFIGQSPDLSGVYRVLNWLEEHGYIASAWDTSTSGPAKKTYHITPAGRKCLRTWVKTLGEYSRASAELLRITRQAARRRG